jgi:CubicO group peptidase (beta-lactamase class C family)
MNWTYNCALDYPIGHNFVYSDLSFILLAEISERVTKKPINVYAKELFESMGMYNSTYLPNLEKELHRIAPTEYSCKLLFIQLIEGKWLEVLFTILLLTFSEELLVMQDFSQWSKIFKPTCRFISTRGFIAMAQESTSRTL